MAKRSTPSPTNPPADPFDWSRVRWDGPYQRQRDDCSYCGAAIDDDAVPLRMWNQQGASCVFCDRCDGAALTAVIAVQKALDRLSPGGRAASFVRPPLRPPTKRLH
jgi:hypothetical protein